LPTPATGAAIVGAGDTADTGAEAIFSVFSVAETVFSSATSSFIIFGLLRRKPYV